MAGLGPARIRGDIRARLQAELLHLETSERPRLLASLGTTDGRDPADQAERGARGMELAQVSVRIDQLRARLAVLDAAPPRGVDDPLGVGTAVVIDAGDGPETYFVAEFPSRGEPTITRDSPLGRALRGVSPGQSVSFRTPRGESRVTLVAVGDPDQAVA